MPDFRSGFTLIELLIAMVIIIALCGLTVTTSQYAYTRAARSRTVAELAGMSAALENYKADSGVYPTTIVTDTLKPDKDGDPTKVIYQEASLELYKALSGDYDANRLTNSSDDLNQAGIIPTTYFNFGPGNLLPLLGAGLTVIAIRDPFGNSYGYSTGKASNPGAIGGHNPTFDLWSTGGTLSSSASPDQTRWIKNW